MVELLARVVCGREMDDSDSLRRAKAGLDPRVVGRPLTLVSGLLTTTRHSYGQVGLTVLVPRSEGDVHL